MSPKWSFLLGDNNGEAYDTIALRLGMTVDNCAKRMSLVRKKLRKVLEKEGVL